MSYIRLKYIANVEMGQSPPSSEYTTEDEGIPFLQGTAEFGEKFPTPEIYSLSPNKFSYENDILFSVRAPVGEININNQTIGIGRGLCAIRAKKDNSQQFLWWALHAVRTQLKSLETGTTYGAVSTEDICNLVLPVHDLNVQNSIAAYLDKEVAKIDVLIKKKSKLIAILNDKKQAITYQAITKGLEPNVSMKDSGIEWLGNIPKHWELVKLKYISNLKSGDFLQAESIKEEGDFKVYGGNGERGYFDDFNHEGDLVLIGRQGALCGNIHFASGKFWATEHAMVCNPISLFDYYWLGKQLELMNLNQYSLAAAQPGLSVEIIKNLFIVFPPINEQRLISNSLKELDQRNDATVKKIAASIELLKQKRTAIISAAINGELNSTIL